MRLKIYDAMWLIHYGSTAVRYKDYVYANYPLGGVKFLVKNVFDDLYRMNRIFVCFDSKTNKSALYANYKSNRHYQGHIAAQSMFAYTALMKCGIPCLKEDGLEGDDLIASAVVKYRTKFNEIIIVSNDRDTAHSVFDNVRVEACSVNGIDINAKNFEVAASPKDPVIYNTLSAYKVLIGDTSDTIPQFKADNGKKAFDIYRDYIAFIEEKVPESDTRPYIFSKKELFELFLKTTSYLTERDKNELNARISVIFPTIVDITELPCEGDSKIDRQEAAKLLSILGEDMLLDQYKLNKVRLSSEEFNLFKASAQVLRDDTFAIDNDCPMHEPFVLDDCDFNMRLF